MSNGAVMAIVIISLLAVGVGAVYGSSTSVAFGAIKSEVTCHYLTPSHDHIGCCYQATDPNNPAVIKTYCYECIFNPDQQGQIPGWRCGQSTEGMKGGDSGNPTAPKAPSGVVETEPTSVAPPKGSLSTATPGAIEQPRFSNAPPPTSQIICPDGSLSDANSNCPSTSTTTNHQVAPFQSSEEPTSGNNNDNNPQPEHHHHKGSDLGQESTTKKHKIPQPDQGTAQSPS